MAHASIARSSTFQSDDEILGILRRMETAGIDETGKKPLPKDEASWKLERLHCPFTWKPCYDGYTGNSVINSTEEKLATVEDEGEEYTAWTTFLLNLILCYEKSQMGAIQNAFENQQECNIIVEHAIARGFTVPVMGVGLKHISDACKIFLLFKSELYDEAIENLSKIIDVEAMDCKDQASVFGIQGALLMEYGLSGMKESVKFIEKALQLDSECGEWHFLLGKALSRVRRIENYQGLPDKREIESLEKAVQLTKNTFYMVLLAQSYMDTARQTSWHHKVYSRKLQNHTDLKLCDEMNEKAFKIYKKACENCKENPYILARCAYGFVRLPPPWGNAELARECVIKGLAKNSSNSFLNHTAGVFYSKQNELDKAKFHFACAAENGSFGSCLHLLAIKQKENKSYNPVSDLKRYIDLFKEKPWREHLLGLLGAFYYFERNDFNLALKYWEELMDSDMNSIHLKSLENQWPHAPHPCNISKIIVHEIIQQRESCSEEEKFTYDKVLAKFNKYHPQLVKSIQNVHEERSKYKNYCAATQKNVLPESDVWRNATRNAVGNFWKVRPTSQSSCGWRKNHDNSNKKNNA